MLVCDVIVSTASADFLLAYSAAGLRPDWGVSYLLPRRSVSNARSPSP
jgi:enoyl-CoA hydratase/carnithine racemase